MNKLKPDYIEERFNTLRKARIKLYIRNEVESIYHRELEVAKGTAIIDGLIEGKNVVERDGQTRKMLTTEYKRLEEARSNKSEATADFDVAKIYVDEIKTLLRVMELPKE